MAKNGNFFSKVFSKDAFRWKKLVIVLALISLLMWVTFYAFKYLSRMNQTPFGYKWSVAKTNGSIDGTINTFEPKKKILEKIEDKKAIRIVTIKTLLYSSEKKSYLFHLSPAAAATLTCNGIPVKIEPGMHYSLIELEKGFNKIRITFEPKNRVLDGIEFYLRKGFFSVDIPFYYFILPESIFSKVLFYFILFLDSAKSAGFFLALLFLLTAIPGIATAGKEKSHQTPQKKNNFFFFLLQYACFMPAVMLAGIYLKNRLYLNLPQTHALLWGIALLLPVFPLVKNIKKSGTELSFKIKPEIAIVLILVILFVFIYLYSLSGDILPTKPIGSGDLDAHMSMVHHFQEHGEFKTDEGRLIYPQALHGFIAIISELFGTIAEKIITPFLAVFLVGIFFLLFLLFKRFFPHLTAIPFFLTLPIIKIPFIFGNVFHFYYFPPVVSIFFFFAALYFFLEDSLPLSSFLLAVSLIVYPLYTIIFSLILFCLVLSRLNSFDLKISGKVSRLLSYFLLPVSFIVILFIVYISYGFNQYQEGFSLANRYNPFKGLHPVNTFALLAGIACLAVNFKKNKKILIYVFSAIFGFCIYYLPYYFLGTGTTYYLLKIIFFLIFWGIIIEAYSVNVLLEFLGKKFRERARTDKIKKQGN